jgi:hypothetical protein
MGGDGWRTEGSRGVTGEMMRWRLVMGGAFMALLQLRLLDFSC